jgi:hypothetical protein
MTSGGFVFYSEGTKVLCMIGGRNKGLHIQKAKVCTPKSQYRKHPPPVA